MKKRWIFMIGLAIISMGCATSQTLDITSEPSRAAVSINDEYVGKTPTVHNIEKINEHDSLVIRVDKLGYESEMKRIKKKGVGIFSSGEFPKRLHFVLQPTLTLCP